MLVTVGLRGLAIALIFAVFLASGPGRVHATTKHTADGDDDSSPNTADGDDNTSPSTADPDTATSTAADDGATTTPFEPYTTTEVTVSGTATITSTRTVTKRPTAKAKPSGWNYIGCYNETVQMNGTGGARTLADGPMEGLDNMTVETCMKFCKGNEYAGLEYARECWCSPYLSTIAAHLNDSSCNMGCVGDESEACGGSWTLTVYQVANMAVMSAASPVLLMGALLAAVFGAILLL